MCLIRHRVLEAHNLITTWLRWQRVIIFLPKKKCLLKGCIIIKKGLTGFLQNYTTCLEVIAARATAGIACMVLSAANNLFLVFFTGKTVRRFLFSSWLKGYFIIFNCIAPCKYFNITYACFADKAGCVFIFLTGLTGYFYLYLYNFICWML